VERVWNAGIVVVVAAGNHGPTPGSISKPADDPLVISVGAPDDNTATARGDDTVAPFSAVGPTPADGLAKPDLVASGAHVVSSRSPQSTVDLANASSEIAPSYLKGSGTSFAAGIVAGAAALLLQSNGSLDPNQVKYRLMSTASPLTVPGVGSQGLGELNVHGAVRS